MAAPKGDINRCPNCKMNRLQVDKVVSVDNAYSDKLYIYQKVQGHCKLCGTKLSWISSFLHWSNTEIMVEQGYEE
jgi:hypothetical protein